MDSFVQKRKYNVVLESDLVYDEIHVSAKAQPLAEVSISEAQNKRPKVTAYVEIRQPCATEIAKFSKTLSSPQLDRRTQFATTTVRLKAPPATTNATSTTSRAGRKVSKIQYSLKNWLVGFDGGDSESDSDGALPVHRKKGKRRNSDDSDFEIKAKSESDDDEVDDALSVASDDGSSISPPTEDMSDYDSDRPRSKKAINGSQSKAAQSPAKTGTSRKATHSCMARLLTRAKGQAKGLDTSLPDLYRIDDIFMDLTQKALNLGFGDALKQLSRRPLRIATMCSGTESPLLAVEMVRDALRELSHTDTIEVEHLFSAEIVPYKQAYIERNFAPPLIFRDITEFIDAAEGDQITATTAYGAKMPLPTNPDIVIAGTSCVDFSRLNNNKKGFGDGGESDRTWQGAMAYCRTYRPAIIIFENIVGADWDLMRTHYREIDYDCEGVFVDTKDFYIPHTRQRGYMVCFDRQRANGAIGLGKRWQDLMAKFKRLASSPVSSFLLPNDQVTVRQQQRSDDHAREVDWAKCEITQMQYRQETRLGNARPFTQWQESGTMVVPENGNSHWYHAQVERVLDTIDGCILRKALEVSGMYDARYKTRIWNLSQSIHRDRDHAPFGMTGCITPSGQFFISDAGRAMAAEETLKLQGLPLEKITFTTESQNELQDLAGNAMTTTVIGAAILAALTAGSKLFEGESLSTEVVPRDNSTKPVDFISGEHDQIILGGSSASDHDVKVLLKASARAMRRCFCEGSYGQCEKSLQICNDCGHTTCIACGGSPVHNYHPDMIDLQAQRISPSTFEEQLRSTLPLNIQFGASIDLVDLFHLPNAKERLAREYINAVQDAISSIYSFSRVRRTHCWTVTYTTPKEQSHLDLIIDDGHAEWRLFVHSSKSISVDDPLRKAFEQPVGKSVIVDELMPREWQWRAPIDRSTLREVTGEGPLVSTWWARNEMPDYKDHVQWSQLHVSGDDEIAGLYRYLPACGKACDSLYQRIDDDQGTRPLYLFLDPTRTDKADRDCFVFAYNKAALEYDEIRSVVARMEPEWRPWHPASRKPKARKLAILAWETAAMDFQSHDICLELQHPKDVGALTRQQLDCTNVVLLSTCKIPDIDMHQDVAGNRANDGRFLSRTAWVLEAMRRNLSDSDWHEVRFSELDNACQSCAPPRPKVRWKLASDMSSIKPYEEPSTAGFYERSVKSRPDPLLLIAQPASSGTLLQFGINLCTLAHRAVARLPRDKSGHPSIKWRLQTSQTTPDFVFKPFTIMATKDMQPYDQDLDMTIKLFPKQALALSWMRSQEQGVQILLEEAEEAVVQKLGWRAEVRAEASLTARGGICADHPGFGKTITSLALIHAEFKEQSASDIIRTSGASSHGLLQTAATLIICPGTLFKQWQVEACEKLRYKVRHNGNGEIILINLATDLDKYTITDFENARIILVNRTVLGAESYVERLANFAGIPGPAAKLGRSLSQWLKFAATQVPEHLEILRGAGLNQLQKTIKTRYKEHISSDMFKAVVPSRRLRGKDYVAANSKQKTQKAESSKPASASIDTKNINKPLFEMFNFNRMVVDEFHQYEAREYAAITNLQASKVWGLSATPAIGDFYEIAQMAGLLGIPLRIGSDARGIMKLKNLRDMRRDMTDFERFDAMRQTPSNAMHARIYEKDQEFLNLFVRRNIMNFDEMRYQDWLCPASLDLDHRVVYTELSQHLNSLDMRIKKGRKAQATDRDQRLNKAVATSDSAEEALSKLAAFFEREKSSLTGMAKLVKEAKAEVERLTTKFADGARAAKDAEAEAFESWRSTRLQDGTLGDSSLIASLQERLQTIAPSTKAKKGSKKATKGDSNDSDDEDLSAAKQGARAKTSDLNTTANRLLVASRSLRFFENVQRLQSTATGETATPLARCDNDECHVDLSPKDNPAVSSLCGHIVCKKCHENLQTKRCVADGCSATMDDTSLLWTAKMGDLSRVNYTPFGSKTDTMLDLLEDVRNKAEQAIIFVQYSTQVDEIEEALSSRSISAIVVKDASRASQQISDFQRSSGEQFTAIVLNASDETAAGSNLQNANHVIFFSPLLRDSQYGYDSTMAQAIGRVRRYGQKRDIHVYRIVALDTIDVDILEHREHRVDALVERGQPPSTTPLHSSDIMDGHGDGEDKHQRTQLVREGDHYSLRPRSWLTNNDGVAGNGAVKMKRKDRVHGWENFSSLIKWSRAYTEDDD